MKEIALALTGTWREEHLCVLKQALALFDFSTAQLRECDAQIERTFSVIKPRFEPEPGGHGVRRGPHAPAQQAPFAQ